MLVHAQLDLAKLKLKPKYSKDKHVTIVLREWRLTTDVVELEIKKQSMRNMNIEGLNLHQENM